jgi:hypothetical protein
MTHLAVADEYSNSLLSRVTMAVPCYDAISEGGRGFLS